MRATERFLVLPLPPETSNVLACFLLLYLASSAFSHTHSPNFLFALRAEKESSEGVSRRLVEIPGRGFGDSQIAEVLDPVRIVMNASMQAVEVMGYRFLR
jgi:hypothetical protein